MKMSSKCLLVDESGSLHQDGFVLIEKSEVIRS